jgi:tRNA-modifying protein YgfZ
MSASNVLPTPLERAPIVEISGADALAFAHAQFTNDVAALDVGAWQYGAWLGAQGRALNVFIVIRASGDRLLLWLPLGDATAMRDGLSRFVFRSKVKIATLDGWTLSHVDDDDTRVDDKRTIALGDGIVFAQAGDRIARLGPSDDDAFDEDARLRWRCDDVAAHLPWIADATRDEFVPQALDLDVLHAVRFDKGCYPGQEIAARLHFRGGNKQRLRRVVLTGDADATPGLRIEDAEGALFGRVLYGARRDDAALDALAVIDERTPDVAALRSTSGHSIDIVDDE